jgi:hypothetical protein
MTELKTAIESLYDVFSRYPRPTTIEVCPCCTKPEATSHLTVGPLRELRFEDIADYSCSAITTQGSVDEFRYFLPRLLQGKAEEEYSITQRYFLENLTTRIGLLGKWSKRQPSGTICMHFGSPG